MRILASSIIWSLWTVLASAQVNLIENPSINGLESWAQSQVMNGVTFALDEKEGSAAPSSLYIKNETADQQSPFNWRQVVDVSRASGQRFRLAVQVKTGGLKNSSRVNLVAQCWDAERKMIHFVSCNELREDTDWTTLDVVFEAPKETGFVFLMAYLVGPGEVWWDDFMLAETTLPLSGPPVAGGRAEARFAELARGLASDIPWEFDSKSAIERAAKEKKPVLVYVRCTDAQEGLDSARTNIEARDIPWHEDGYRKDLLFRAGPLTDRDVAEMIKRRFVPVCSTYHLSAEGMGRAQPSWTTYAPTNATKTRLDPEAGAGEKGSLAIAVSAEAAWAAWQQYVAFTRAGVTLELRARVRSEGLSTGSRAEIDIQLTTGDKKPVFSVGTDVEGGGEWRLMRTSVEVPAGCRSAFIRLKLIGRGQVWFDDIELRVEGSDENLLRDGDAGSLGVGDPLEAFGLRSSEVVTPALLFVNEKAEVAHTLHRVGALSSDLVDRWLRACLDERKDKSKAVSAEEAYLEGDLDRASTLLPRDRKPESRLLRARLLIRRNDFKKADRELRGLAGDEARFLRAQLAMRRADWADAEKELNGLDDTALATRTEARYQLGAVLQRQGRLDEATKIWKEIADESPFGRKAALAAMNGGPRPWMSETLRAWPEPEALVDRSETVKPGDFDVRESLVRLLEFQRPDGSWTDHSINGIWDPAITAIALDALDLWKKKLPAAERKRAEAAIERALPWLVNWSGAAFSRADTFNAPYAMMPLIRHDQKAAVPQLVQKILSGQEQDGNWTIYGPQRPASFNTAQCLIALCAAKKAGYEVAAREIDRAALALESMRQAESLYPYSTAAGHDWMTTVHGSIGRDSLCETALLAADRGDQKRIEAALGRFLLHHEELRSPTKKLYDWFNGRGHGGYFFFYSHRNAVEAARHADAATRRSLHKAVRKAVLEAREGDGSFMDHYMIGRAYATAMALVILAETDG